MMEWFADTWKTSDIKMRGWLAIQFEKAFPEYKESIEKNPELLERAQALGIRIVHSCKNN